jgi:hypothetical protein
MVAHSHPGGIKAAGLVRIAICALSAMSLLAFSLRPAYQSTVHLRTPEVRRSVERHTSVAEPEASPAGRIADGAVVPALAAPVDAAITVKPRLEPEPSTEIPLTRLLLRLKLGPSRADGQDLLL